MSWENVIEICFVWKFDVFGGFIWDSHADLEPKTRVEMKMTHVGLRNKEENIRKFGKISLKNIKTSSWRLQKISTVHPRLAKPFEVRNGVVFGKIRMLMNSLGSDEAK